MLKLDGSIQDDDGRFSRFELIGWWDQQRLHHAKVLVVGAGALGNEILKNLALLGVGEVVVVDLDTVENSNLSRSVLFREADCGRPKAEVAADRAREIYPEMKVHPVSANVVYDLGMGVYRWADVILGGLDNREARVAINTASGRMGKVWIDGAIERLDGVARVFDPACGPCYECTMSEVDWKMLEARRSCALLTRDEMQAGKVPTTPTTASIIAGIQVQEAVKYLHGLDVISGQGYVFDGTNHQSYLVTYTQQADCPAHDVCEAIETLDADTANTTVSQLLDRAISDLGSGAVVELTQDLLHSLECPGCESAAVTLSSLGQISESDSRCPNCKELRVPHLYHTLDPLTDEYRETLKDRTLRDIGVPEWDVLTARRGETRKHYEFGRDAFFRER